MNQALLALWLSALVACVPDAPATPSFQQDVMPILAANCLRCHSTPAIGGAPEEFRLDVLDDVTVREPVYMPSDLECNPPQGQAKNAGCFPVVVSGAASYAGSMAARVADDDDGFLMPPRFRIDDRHIETLENWAATGALRGEPRPGNAEPHAAVTIERTGMILHFTVLVDDVDRDAVGGSLHARLAGTEVFVGFVQSGVADVRWDTTGVTAGTYQLSARLDDGGAVVVISLGTATVGGS